MDEQLMAVRQQPVKFIVLRSAYKKNPMSTDRESGRGNKRARVTRGSSLLLVLLFIIFIFYFFPIPRSKFSSPLFAPFCFVAYVAFSRCLFFMIKNFLQEKAVEATKQEKERKEEKT
jgi:hypothetical protein